MQSFEILAAALAIFGVALLAGWVVVRITSFQRARRAPGKPAPPALLALIADRVPITRTLAPEDWDRLLDLVRQFLNDKHFEGHGGLEVTEDMKVIVAAQACLLILNLDAGCYPGVQVVLLYPGTFVRRTPELDPRLYMGPIPFKSPLLGEHVRGAVVLSWDSVAHGAARAGDGENVVFHEFAHELDSEDGLVDGIPLLEAPSSTRVWARVLQQRFEELGRTAMEDEPGLLNPYGATNRAEFFAVATETFFEKPQELQQRYPDLYEELKGFYRQDPAARRLS